MTSTDVPTAGADEVATTGAHRRALAYAARLRAAGYTVELSETTRELELFDDGDVLLPGRVFVHMLAQKPHASGVGAGWTSITDGARRTTRFLGGDYYGVAGTRKRIHSTSDLDGWVNVLAPVVR